MYVVALSVTTHIYSTDVNGGGRSPLGIIAGTTLKAGKDPVSVNC